MRKSERLRILEIEFVKLQMQVELMSNWLGTLLEEIDNKSASQAQDLDAGKWYNRNS